MAVVTGASAGLGVEFADALAQSGANVVLAARREQRLRELAHQLERRHGVRATPIRTDLTEEADIVALVQAAAATAAHDQAVRWVAVLYTPPLPAGHSGASSTGALRNFDQVMGELQ